MEIGDIVELKELTGQKCVITKIVEGGFGRVYFLKTSSLKFMPNLVMKMLKIGKNYEEFEREAVLWSSIGHHKNIAFYICCGKLNNCFYILSKRYDKTLAEVTNLTDPVLLKIILGMINGLNYAYQKVGLIHRDIKPNNIFIDNENNIKIADFGLSSYYKKIISLSLDFKEVDYKTTVSQLPFGGTFPYMAPELFMKSSEFNIQTDIFALGVSLFYITTNGLLPYSFPEYKINTSSFKYFLKSQINKKIRDVILNCINLNKDERYNNYSDILEALNIKETKIYNPGINDVINYIQTLRRVGQKQASKKLLLENLKIYSDNPFLINQLAIIEKEENGIDASVLTYENLFSQSKKYDKLFYVDCFYNLIALYFESKQFNKIVPFVEGHLEYLVNSNHIVNDFIEYGVYLGFKKEYIKTYDFLYNYLLNHSYNNLHALFFLVISNKVDKIKDSIELIRVKNTETIRNIIKLYNTIVPFTEIIINIENEIFGGL